MAATYAEDKLTVGITGRTYPANLEVKDIHPKIKYHETAKEVAASLFAMQGKEIKRKPTGNIKFYCYEKEPFGEWMYLTAEHAAGATTFTVDDGAGGVATGPLKVDDVLQMTSGDFTTTEQVIVLTIPGDNTFTVTRAYGSSSAAVWPDNTPVRIMHNASQEDSTTPTIKNIIPSEEYNLCTQLRTPMGGTYRFLESDFYASANSLAEMRLEKWIVHLKQKVKNFLFSERKADTTTGRTVCEGIIPAILRRGGQYKAVNGNITFDLFLEICSDYIFKVGGDRKIAICPPVILNALSYWKKQQLLVMNDEEYLNLKVKRVELSDGELICVREKLFQGGPLAPKGLFGSCFVTFDPQHVTYRPFKGYDEKLIKDTGAKGTLGTIDEYLSDSGAQWDVITAHTLVSLITGFE